MLNSSEKYLRLLAEKYPSEQAVCREIINLSAIMNLPKGTEHFMSDLHGEYDAFCHIVNNCSGVIREKVNRIFSDRLSDSEQREMCTLIYYPYKKLALIKKENRNTRSWYKMILNYLIELARDLSSKYTRLRVRSEIPEEFGDIIDELIHIQKDEDDNQILYHENILDTIIKINNADEFISAISGLIKQLAVDHLHIVGDIFDRGPYADKIIDMLMKYHSIDIEWGNHDILWMGACAGSEACIASAIRNNIRSGNTEILEKGYGISLSNLILFAGENYSYENIMDAVFKAISVILFKLEGQIIERHPEYNMEDRKLLHLINMENHTIKIGGKVYELNNKEFPTVIRGKEYELSKEETKIINELKNDFVNSIRLNKHIKFLYSVGSMYRIFNDNLLYHGCIPLDKDGNFEGITIDGSIYKGKAYFDYADKVARSAYFGEKTQSELDFMWYLWCGRKSPLSGRNVKTFERTFISDESAWVEETDDYYHYYYSEKICSMILREFGLYSPISHIINGHTPVKTGKGEKPVRANGKLIVIDGGFCKNYHKTTGIAGYTLIYNSHGMRIKAHQPFESVNKALTENKDIESSSDIFETKSSRIRVKDTDTGNKISQDLSDLQSLLDWYRRKKFSK